MKKIQSIHNPKIKKIVTLQTSKGRSKEKQFIAEGSRTCQTLLESPLKLIQLYVTEKMVPEAHKLTGEKNMTGISEMLMEKIAPSKTPSGILGVFSTPQQKVPNIIKPGLVLADISDPGNMGTLIRSSVTFGFPQIIIIDGCDPWNPKVIQASAGTIGFAQILQLNWDELKNHAERPPLVALVPHGGTTIKAGKKNRLLVVGNEAHGIPAKWLKDCEELLTLPMPGKTESLNAAVAGSIALYLLSR